jgi:hypothetical protein
LTIFVRPSLIAKRNIKVIKQINKKLTTQQVNQKTEKQDNINKQNNKRLE